MIRYDTQIRKLKEAEQITQEESLKKKLQDYIKQLQDIKEKISEFNDKIENEQENRRRLRYKKSKTSMLNSKAKESLQDEIDKSLEDEEDLQTDKDYLLDKSKKLLDITHKTFDDYKKIKNKSGKNKE